MATETLFPNGDDNGWPTGDWTDIDESIASADGAILGATSEPDVVLIDLDDSALTDADTINSVTVKIRAKDTGSGGKNFLDVDLFIGGAAQGTTRSAALSNVYATLTLTNAAWDVDWTAAQLDGMQLEITSIQTGKGVSATWEIDAIDVDIDYTAPAADDDKDPYFIAGQDQSVIEPFEIVGY